MKRTKQILVTVLSVMMIFATLVPSFAAGEEVTGASSVAKNSEVTEATDGKEEAKGSSEGEETKEAAGSTSEPSVSTEEESAADEGAEEITDEDVEIIPENPVKIKSAPLKAPAATVETATVTFNSGTGGKFEGGSTSNVVTYELVAAPAEKYAHTPNVSDTGLQSGNYAGSLNNNQIVTINGASSLKVELYYNGESVSYDWVSVWKGNYPSYTAASNATSTGYATTADGAPNNNNKFGGSQTGSYTVNGNNLTNMGHTTLTFTGDSVTFGFKSDSSGYGNGYGYYAIVTGYDSEGNVISTGDKILGDIVSGEYKEPIATNTEYIFKDWSPSLTTVSGTTTITATYEEDLLDSSSKGTYDGVSWKIKKDGTLVIGKAGQTQTFTNAESRSWPWSQYRSQITAVKFAGTVNGNGSHERMFYYCQNLTDFDSSGFNTSNITDMSEMFHYCRSLTDLDVSRWNTNKVTNMSGMFTYCDTLTSLDVSEWNTGNVTDMSDMFMNCHSLIDLDVSRWNTSKVTDMSYMFCNCRGLTSLDVSEWNTGKVTNMDSMFMGLYSLTSLDVSTWNVSNVTNMKNMFYSCSALTSMDASGWNASKVTDMRQMFRNCSSLTSPDLSDWNIGSAADMSSMFYECSSLTSPDVSGWNISKVTNMDSMFYNCSKLTSLDVSGWNTGSVTDMGGMFSGCSSLTSLDVSGFDTSNVTDMSNMFCSCSKLTSLDVSGWNTGSVTKMHTMFASCSGLTALDVSGWDTGSVTTMSSMFSNCSGLTSLDVSGWDTGSVTTMAEMFFNCESLTSLDLSGWDTSSVTNMRIMFYECSGLTDLDLSGRFDTSNVTNIKQIFSYCDNLSTVNLGEKFSFSGKNISTANDKALLPGDKWIRETTGDIYTAGEIRNSYDGFTMADIYHRLATIKFNANGGTANPINIDSYIGGSFRAELPSATRKGYDFRGWFTEPEGGTEIHQGDEVTQTEYYAHWEPHTYTIILDPNGGFGVPIPVVLEYDQEYITGAPFTYENYVFDGWNTRKNGTGESFDKTDSILMLTDEDGAFITLYAQWTQENFTVTFDSMGGNEVPSRIVKKGKPLGKIYTPVKSGYTFVGWYTAETGGTAVTETTVITEDLTCYARWEKNPTITFDPNGGTVSETEREVGYNKAFGRLPIPSKANYTFDGWYTAETGGSKITESTTTTTDKTYYAHWKIRLNFDPNGGKITKDAKYVPPEAETATIEILKTDNVSADGSTYSGGYGNNKAETKTVTIDGANKLYVRITYATESTSYDWVSIYPSGITPSDSNCESSVSGKLGGATKTTKVFEVPGDTVQIFFRSDGSADNYYGYYAEITDVNSALNDWDPYTDEAENYTVMALAEAEKEGYTFTGWYTSPTGGTKVEIGDMMDLTENSVVYAHWEPLDKVTITFDSQGGSACSSMELYRGQKAKGLPKPTKDGAIFLGWFTTPAPTRSIEANTPVTADTVIDEDVLLYARWQTPYTVTFNKNGATSGSNFTRTTGDDGTFNTIPGLRCAGYVLEGWYPNADGIGKKLTTETIITGNTTYYAKWVPEMHDGASDTISYIYGSSWSNASNTNVDNVNGNLEFHPTDYNAQTASLHIRFEVNEAIDTTLPVGAVTIRIPKSVFKGWNGEVVDTNNVSANLPLYPNKRNGMYFSYMDDGDSYILINNTALAGGAGVDATFSYNVNPNDVPGGAIDSNGNYVDGYDFFHDTIPVVFAVDADLDGTPETSEQQELSLEMHTKVTPAQSKSYNSISYVWQDSWGEKPLDADEYFYIIWTVEEDIYSNTNQPHSFSISEDTVHDGTAIIVPTRTNERRQTSTSTYISRQSVVTKHPKSLLVDLDETGLPIHNEAIVTEHWKSGYDVAHRVSADTIVYGRQYPTGEFDKHFWGWPTSDTTANLKYGGQEDILDDKKEVYIPYQLIYDGSSNGQPITWDDTTKTYNAPERTIMMRDGISGDVLYSSGRAQAKYVWEPSTGNIVLGDNDYYIKALTINITEYDAEQHNGLWSTTNADNAKSLYDPTEIWVRLKGEEDFDFYQEVPATMTSAIDLPANTVGFELRHKSTHYSTKMDIKADMYLKPTKKVQNLVRDDVELGATSIIKNKAICRIWNGDDMENPFFRSTNFVPGEYSAFKDLWELNVSTTNLQVRKYASPQASTVFDVERGTQDTPMLIVGRNYNNSSRVKRLESGIFYDLLPVGTSVDESTIFGVVNTANNTVSTSVSLSSYNSKKSSALDRNYYSVEFVDDWEGSGRTMMIITVGLPEKIKACSIEFYYMLHNTYENIVDTGTTVENDVAFANTSENKTPYNGTKSNQRTIIEESDLYKSLENRYGDTIAFAEASTNYIPVDAFSWGYLKSVMTGSSYAEEGATIPNNEYTYRLTYSQSEYSKSDKIVFFDILEGGTETHPSQWYGTLKNVNTRSASEMLKDGSTTVTCAPVVYYATKARDSFTGADWDVTNTSTWSRVKPANDADITAVAVDCSKASDGSDFIMKGKAAMNIYITMKAPDGAENISKSTTNEGISYARKFTGTTPEGEPTPEYSDATVTIRDTDEELHKTSDPESGTEEDPADVIYGDVINYTIAYTNDDEEITYKDVVLTDTIPEGLTIEKDNISVYIADPENAVKIGNSARVEMTKTGQQLDFTIHEVLPGETVHIVIPTTVDVRKGTFINQAEKISVNGYEKRIQSEITYHETEEHPVNIEKRILGERTVLPGATLQLLNSSNTVIEEWVSTGEPKEFILGVDKYTIHEVTPPAGFKPANDVRFEIQRGGTIVSETNATIEENTVVMYDEENPRIVRVTKNLTGTGLIPDDQTIAFPFRITLTSSDPALLAGEKTFGGSTYIDGVLDFTVTAAEPVELTDIPRGVDFVVTELPTAGFTSKVENASGTIEAGTTYDVTATNKKTHRDTEDIKIRKEVSGNAGGAEFTFTVHLTNLDGLKGYILSDGTRFVSDSNGEATVTIHLHDQEEVSLEDIPVGAKYTVTEAANPFKPAYEITDNGLVDGGGAR